MSLKIRGYYSVWVSSHLPIVIDKDLVPMDKNFPSISPFLLFLGFHPFCLSFSLQDVLYIRFIETYYLD